MHKTREEFDQWLLTKEKYFTVVYFQGRGKYYRYEAKTFEEAEQHALSLKRPCMVYAVCNTGVYEHTVHVRNYNTVDTCQI